MTTNFVFPSDAARAENDELNRVCCYVEELLDQNRELTGTLVKLQRKVKRVKKFINANYNHGVRIEGQSVDNYFKDSAVNDIYKIDPNRIFISSLNTQEIRECRVDIQKQLFKDAARQQRIQGGFVDMNKCFITGQQTAQSEDVNLNQIRERLAAAMEKIGVNQMEAAIRQGFYTPPKQFEGSLFDNFTFPIRIPKPFDYARNSFDSPFLFVPETRLNRIKQLQEAFKLATLDPNLFTVERDENGMVISEGI